ncbi:hypothetical protein BDN72DRAFT_742581, partial [Pluteus cervinus]
PPKWAMIPEEEPLYPFPTPQAPPSTLLLDSNSACFCTGTRTNYDPTQPTICKPCMVYGLQKAYLVSVELQRCPGSTITGNLHYIGPEHRDNGFFNLNNTSIFTHELLNDYTSSYTTSETPLNSFSKQTSHRYAENNSPHQFISDEAFRSAWFAFVNLQLVDDTITCPNCGPTPSDTIWDGVTLAFSRKHLRSTLEPPTSLLPTSP